MVKDKTGNEEEQTVTDDAVDSEKKVEIAIEERPKVANLVVDKYAKWSFGVGFIPMPAVDFVALMGVQIKMLHEVAQVYGLGYSNNKVRNTVGVLLSAALPQSATNASMGSFIKSIPVFGGLVGAFVMPTACAAATYALGIVFIKHFESGGTFLDIDLSVMKSQVADIAAKYRKSKEKESASVAT